MSAIPAPPPQPTSMAPTAAAPRAQVIADALSGAARLPLGSDIRGHVVAGAPKGMVHIQTEAGMLVGKSTVPLSAGTDVALQLQATTPRLQLLITAMTGQSPHAHAPPPAARAALGDAVTVSLRSPDNPAPAPSAASRPLPILAPGVNTNATVVQPAPSHSAALPAGSQVPVRVVAVPSPAASSGSPVSAPGQTLGGTVMPSAPGAPTMLATPFGTIRLDAISALARGNAVTLEITGPPTPPSSPFPAAGTAAIPPLSPTSARWPALEMAIATLKGIDPAAARHVTEAAAPRANAGLTSQALFFLRALGRGNLSEWLGKGPTEALGNANPALLSRLSDEFRKMASTAGETEADDWRVVHLPLASGAEIEPVRLLMRRRGGQQETEKTDPGTRFVVDVSLSKLGRLQFDGLVRDDGKRLDLIVRSDPPLPPTLHGDIRALFTRSSEIAGLQGDVGFQAAPPEFIDVKADPPATTHNQMIV